MLKSTLRKIVIWWFQPRKMDQLVCASWLELGAGEHRRREKCRRVGGCRLPLAA